MLKNILIYIFGLLVIITNVYGGETPLPKLMSDEEYRAAEQEIIRIQKDIEKMNTDIRSIQQHIVNVEMSAKEHYVKLTPEENYMIMIYNEDIEIIKVRLKLNQKRQNEINNILR